jgi:hypothetical protein
MMCYSKVHAFLTYIVIVSLGKLDAAVAQALSSIVDTSNEVFSYRRNLAGCSICDTRPLQSLVLRYELPSATSSFQGSRTTCVQSDYPSSALLSVGKDATIIVSQRSKITIVGNFENRTMFNISKWGECYIDTSCDVPLIVGDKIGPFLLLGGNNCNVTSPPVPTKVPTKISPSAVPTIKGTKAPTKKPTNKETPNPTSLSTSLKPTPLPTSKKPIVKPTKAPTPMPTTPPPSPSPTNLTSSPTIARTPLPTRARTPAPTMRTCVVTDKALYECADPITVTVDYSRQIPSEPARIDDRIAIFPCYITEYREADLWQWMCGAPPLVPKTCSRPRSSGTVIFNKLPNYNQGGQKWPLSANYNSDRKEVNRCFKIVILRNSTSGGPYTPYCDSERFTINENSRPGCGFRLTSPTDT